MKNILLMKRIIVMVITSICLVGCSASNNEDDLHTYEQVESNQSVEEKQGDAFDMEIPEISNRSTALDANFESIKKQMGYSLSGPDEGFRSISESNFYLTNIDDVDCYMNVSSMNEMLGVKEGKIVFFGMYGLSSSSTRVKDLVPEEALSANPAVYTIRANTSSKAGLDSYVWKLENGYMAVTIVPINNMNFYEQLVFSVVFVDELDYLSYIE